MIQVTENVIVCSFLLFNDQKTLIAHHLSAKIQI